MCVTFWIYAVDLIQQIGGILNQECAYVMTFVETRMVVSLDIRVQIVYPKVLTIVHIYY